MPQLLEHIHQIARRLKRDVLIAMPARGRYEEALLGCDAGRKRGIWRKTRRQAIAFLDAEGIKHIDCFGPASDFLIRPWLGEMFIDVPVNLEDEGYRKVCAFFEHPGETPKFSDYHLFVVQYDQALVPTDK